MPALIDNHSTVETYTSSIHTGGRSPVDVRAGNFESILRVRLSRFPGIYSQKAGKIELINIQAGQPCQYPVQ